MDADRADAALDRKGDEEAFNRLAGTYRAKLYRTAVTILLNHADAEDATHTALLRAWRSISQLRGDAAFGVWLTSILRRVDFESIRLRRPVELYGDAPTIIAPAQGQTDAVALLGIKVAPSRAWEILTTEGLAPSPQRTTLTGASFLRSQAEAILAGEVIETVTLPGQRQYLLAAIHRAPHP